MVRYPRNRIDPVLPIRCLPLFLRVPAVPFIGLWAAAQFVHGFGDCAKCGRAAWRRRVLRAHRRLLERNHSDAAAYARGRARVSPNIAAMVERRLRVGITGAGAMGTLIGYHLAQLCDVTMFDQNAALLECIKRDGLRVNDAAARPVSIARTVSDLFGSSMLFLFVKAVDTLRALRPFAGQLNPATPVISLQNGIRNESAIKAALGGAVPVVLGITTESSLSVAPGHVQSSQAGHTVVGSGGAAPETSQRVAQLLSSSGLRTSVVYDIRPHLWGKLVANTAVNAISALLDCPAGAILTDENATRLAKALAREAVAVAAQSRINLPYSDAWAYVEEVIAVGADSKSSMAFDLETGHPTEIDHINGAIVAAGRRVGVPTPYNEAIVQLIKARESIAAAVPSLSIPTVPAEESA